MNDFKIVKELSEISWLVEEPEYRADSALSYSNLSKYDREGFEKLDHLFDHVSTPALTQGSMLDAIITGGKEEFDNGFFVGDFPSMGEKPQQIADVLFNQYKDQYTSFSDIPDGIILNEANNVAYQSRWTDKNRVKSLKEMCGQYYNLKHLAGDRVVVDTDTFNKVLAMVRALHQSPATHRYFKEDDLNSPIRRYYQLKFKATFNNVDYRCMADLLIVDYKNKIIYPCDLKSTGHREFAFEQSFLAWRYLIQAKLYWRIIRENLDNDDYFKDFELENFRFIVVNKDSLVPLVWEFPYTRHTGTLVDEDGKEYRDPFVIGSELHEYLTNRPPVPNNIDIKGINVINNLHPKNNESKSIKN